MNVSITGHRPERIPNPGLVKQRLLEAYEDLGAYRIIQGMAAGVDLWAARAAYDSQIPYVCARPWAGHTPRKEDKRDYEMALKFADEVVVVDAYENYRGPWVYQKRNEWMVNRAQHTIAVWDGVEKGGTWNCVAYALKMRVPVYRIDPVNGEVSHLG